MKLKNILKNTSFFLSQHKKSLLKKLAYPVNEGPLIWAKTYYKEYARFPRIQLSLPEEKKVSFYEVLSKRKSIRDFSKKEADIEDIAQLLYYSAGLKEVDVKGGAGRYYPSAGARYPLEVYIISKNVSDLNSGIYHYNVKLHELEVISQGDNSKELMEIAGGVNMQVSSQCAFWIVVTAVFGRTEIKYGKTAYRLILLEAGHLGQNFGLVGAALNLGSCFLGGFVDRKMNNLLGLNEEKEQALFLMAFGEND